ARGRLPAGDLVETVVPHQNGEIFLLEHADGGETAELHQQRAVAFERDDMTLGLRDRDAERDRDREPHAAQHVEILRPVAARPQVEIGVADAADDGFVALELTDEALGQLEAVHDFRVVRAGGHGHALKTLPPVNSGERMKATGACVATACLIDRSAMKPRWSSWVMVWFSTASESSTGRMVLHTMACPRLNSPSVPRSETKISAGICDGTTSEASALGMVAKPDVCISTAPRKPPIQAPVTMPSASSSRTAEKVVK